jgi:hypothetical protein
MKSKRNLIVAGVAAAALACTSGLAFAVSAPQHTLNVPLPDGGTAVVRYSGDVAPQVTFKDVPGRADAQLTDPAGFWAPDPAFADLQRLSAAMDRRMDDLMKRLYAPGGEMKAGGFDTAGLPSDDGLTMVSSNAGGGDSCVRSVEMTQGPGDKAPKVVSRSFGNCKAFDTPAAPAAKGQSL